jgi:UTP--glucose-1-phosphate uridylyltransferase
VKISECIFPVAGLGTRFLPATKANPKEMLPIVDKPLIQYATEEAQQAGIESLIFVTGRNKRSIPDHFDKAYELEAELLQAGKHKLLKLAQDVIMPNVNCIYLRQSEALGLGHAIHCAKPVAREHAFAVSLADDLIFSEGRGVLQQMIELFEHEQCSILAVQEVPKDETHKYGIVEVEDAEARHSRVLSIVEKPASDKAPSNLAVVGRYILTSGIFAEIESTGRGAGGEIQLTDAISRLMKKEKVLAYRFTGTRYDCGSKLGYLQATVEYALKHAELADEFRQYLKQLAI